MVLGALALAVAGSTTAPAAIRPQAVSVHVQRRLSVLQNVHVSFQPTVRLPQGGYYYAVIVLEPYKRYTKAAPPPCASSSDMQRTDYGYPHAGRLVALALTPAHSKTGHWCRGGSYAGGIYAVPHAPPCNSAYPCRSEPYEAPSPCFKLEGGHTVCGIVAQPKTYAYPEGLPRPLAQGTRIVGRFTVTF